MSSYELRIQRYLDTHPGATRQQARGHRPGEHAERVRRERQAGRLTTYQRQAIRSFAREQAARLGEDDDDVIEMLLAWVEKVGWNGFVELRAEQRKLRKEYVAGVFRTGNRDLMEELADDWETPFGWRLLFYH